MSSGLNDLDRVTKGLSAGSLVVVAGRPSMGKSLLVLQIADHIARAERRAVAIACAHDGAGAVAQRLIAVRADVGANALIWGWPMDADSKKRVQLALDQADKTPILLDDSCNLNVRKFANRALRFATERSVPLGAIIVDGIDGFGRGRGGSAGDRVTAQLRFMSERLMVPIITTANVHRAVERRRDHRPQISDFNKFYAAIVRAADLVLTIYRDDVYDLRSIDPGVAELTLLRHRSGRRGTVRVRLGEGRFRHC